MNATTRHGSATVTLPSDRENAALNTMILEERDGVTTMTITALHVAKAHRDAHIGSGMEKGMQVSLNRLEDVAVGLNTAA